MKMRLFYGLIIIAAAIFAGLPLSYAATTISDYPSGVAAGGIGTSRHNMGSLGRVIRTDATTQICVFCHTPHHTNQSGGVSPLWNRSVTNSSSYTAYGTTIGGTTVANGDIGSTTLACLSCHDGVTTFDNLINRPGKDTAGGEQGWRFMMPGWTFNPLLPGPQNDLHSFGDTVCRACHPANTEADMVSRLVVGTDLSNDHPVSIPYTERVASLRSTGSIIAQIDLASGLGSTNANIEQNLWAVKGFISTDATIGDLLRNGKVECSSCHDPHFRNLSWNEAEPTWVDTFSNWCGYDPENCSDGMFLRRVGGNTGSGVCRTCHNK